MLKVMTCVLNQEGITLIWENSLDEATPLSSLAGQKSIPQREQESRKQRLNQHRQKQLQAPNPNNQKAKHQPIISR